MYPGNTIFLAENLSLDDSVSPCMSHLIKRPLLGINSTAKSTVPRSFGLFLLSSSMREMTTRI
jgi:hypothetical protein